MKKPHTLPTVEEFLARVGTPAEGTPEGVALKHLKHFHENRRGSYTEALQAGWSAINFMALAASRAHWGPSLS